MPDDLVEYILGYLTLEEFYNIGWILLGGQYWKKSQLINWKNSYIHSQIPYEFIDNGISYSSSTNLLKGPAIIRGMYNQSLLKFIYHYYWKSNVNIQSHDGTIILQRHIPMDGGIPADDHIPPNDCTHLVYNNPFMYDTLMCLLKFLPYKKKRFQKFLDCRKKICNNINEVIDTNIPIIYSWMQVRLGITRINLGEVRNILLCCKSDVTNLDLKIQHIVDSMDRPSADGIPLQTFTWESYNNHPQLLIPMIGNIEEDVNTEFNSTFVNDMSKYETIVTHFYPFIYDSILKESIEQTLSLCKTNLHNTTIAHPVNLHINNDNLELLFSTIAILGKTRLEILLENIPHKYALLTFGDKTRINEMGIIMTVSIVKSKLLSPFHTNILIKICKTYFNLWFSHIHQFKEEDQDSIVKCLKIIGGMKGFTWSPTDYYNMAINSNNDYLIKYVVDNIPRITKEHYRVASEHDISPLINEYIKEKHTYHKYITGIDITNTILVICIIMFIICITILKSKKSRMFKDDDLMYSIRIGNK